VRQFISECGYGDAIRARVQGDASTRSYERFALGEKQVILMNSPRRPDGPAIRDGKPYSAVAHLAESVIPFVAMANGLRERGFSAPAILHADLDQGLLFIEDLGDERVVTGDPPAAIKECYETAVDALSALHEMKLPDALMISPHVEYRIPNYDIEAFLIEAELLLDWFMPRFGVEVAPAEREQFRELWRALLQPALDMPPTWVLRDFHSPNLLWLRKRSGLARLGILDFQDALMGPGAYDLASLLQDARIDVPEQAEVAWLGRYVLTRREKDPNFDHTQFIKIYVTLAAQRASKILGIFTRLDLRDGKPQYLRHLPRIWGYLQRSLSHPALKPLKAWYGANVPSLKTI
jgi:aminoglycoside/choline kinase family phosphotransferase